jgi:hypothetical protein
VKYLLDTMVVSYFLQAGREQDLTAAARHCSMVLANDVYRELEKDRRRGRHFTKWFATSNIEVRSIPLGSPASATLAALLDQTSPNQGRGGGERACIALASSDTSLTFVTQDRGAMWLALRELWAAGERILGVPGFLRRLIEAEALAEPLIADEIIPLTNAPRPTWWSAWRAGLVPRREPS